MPPLTTSLLQRFGDQWTHALGINDLYFDFMAPSLASAGIDGDGPPHNISAGDGSEVAFQRIRTGQYQVGTVAEPLRLQGWQLVDELNRALRRRGAQRLRRAGAPVRAVATSSSTAAPSNIYDPDNGYQRRLHEDLGRQVRSSGEPWGPGGRGTPPAPRAPASGREERRVPHALLSGRP